MEEKCKRMLLVTFYNMAGASVDPPTLRHVARTVANVDIRSHVIDTVFTLFDENRKYYYTV